MRLTRTDFLVASGKTGCASAQLVSLLRRTEIAPHDFITRTNRGIARILLLAAVNSSATAHRELTLLSPLHPLLSNYSVPVNWNVVILPATMLYRLSASRAAFRAISSPVTRSSIPSNVFRAQLTSSARVAPRWTPAPAQKLALAVRQPVTTALVRHASSAAKSPKVSMP